jgi:cellobiose phosphorylase
MLGNRYGEFVAAGGAGGHARGAAEEGTPRRLRAFEVRDHKTPMPWCNVVSNGRFGFVVSQNGGGFSWFDDAQHCVLTRWEMDLARDTHGKFIYLSDLDSGDVWSVTPAPTWHQQDAYSCTHEVGATTFRTSAHGIEAEWTLTVAPDDPAEVWLVKITNTTRHARRLRVASWFEWCCGAAPDAKREFHRLFFTTWHDAKRRAVLATKNMWDIPPKSERQHWNQPWPYVAAFSVGGVKFDKDLTLADKRAFLGRYGQPFKPSAMSGEIPTDGKFGRFGDAACALGGDLSLAPGQSVSMHYVLAIGADEPSCCATLDKFASPAAATGALDGARAKWDQMLAPASVSTDRPDFDAMVETWLPYQAIAGRLWGRTGYYQQSGAFGFRDQLQDTHVWLALAPRKCLDHIHLAATRQFTDGSVNHWWHALADFGNHTACSDDYLWLPMLVASYIKETGDYGVLRDRKIGFRDNADLKTDLLDHCLRSFARAFKRTSPRGIPLIGSCDWNDGLSAMGVGEKGESVWVGWFLAYLLRDWSTILDQAGLISEATDFRARREKYVKAINDHAWDGSWYRYGTKDNGDWVGAMSSSEGKIHLNAQTWAIMCDGAPDDRAAAAWQSVRERLLSDYGPLLLAPAYTVPDASIGYVTRYAPGARENGGVYMHAATWALLTACKLKDTASVEKIWGSISPPVRCGGENGDAEKYWAEPYVLPGNVDGPLSEMPGKAGWTWYSGSAAWLHKVALEWMIGIRPTLEGLVVDPCPARSLGKVDVTRTYRGRPIRVRFDATGFEAGSPCTVTMNGRTVPGGVVTAEMLAHAGGSGGANAESVELECRWGTKGQTGKNAAAGSGAGVASGGGRRR